MGHIVPDADVGALLRVLVLATRASRVLEIGTGIGDASLPLAGVLPKNGMLVTMEADEALAKQARERFSHAGLADRVNVVIGDAQRMLHKVAGPFDLIFQSGQTQAQGPMLDTLVGLLRPGGVLVTRGVHAHPLLFTSIVPPGDGVAISVKP